MYILRSMKLLSLCHSLSPHCSICVVQWVDLSLTISPLLKISPFLNMSPLVNIADARPLVSDETTCWWGRRIRGPNDRSDVILSYLDIHTTDWLWWYLVLAVFPSFLCLPLSVRSNLGRLNCMNCMFPLCTTSFQNWRWRCWIASVNSSVPDSQICQNCLLFQLGFVDRENLLLQ